MSGATTKPARKGQRGGRGPERRCELCRRWLAFGNTLGVCARPGPCAVEHQRRWARRYGRGYRRRGANNWIAAWADPLVRRPAKAEAHRALTRALLRARVSATPRRFELGIARLRHVLTFEALRRSVPVTAECFCANVKMLDSGRAHRVRGGTLRRWLAAWRRRGPIGVLDQRGRPRGSRRELDAETWRALCRRIAAGCSVERANTELEPLWSKLPRNRWGSTWLLRERLREQTEREEARLYLLGPSLN